MTADSPNVSAPTPWRRGRHGAAAQFAERGGRLGDAFAFAVPLLLPVQFAVGGRLFLPEVVLLVALPFLLDDARRRRVSRVSHAAVVLGVLWLFGLLVTDIYRETPFDDYSRGWSNVAFFLLNFAALSLVLDGRWHRVTLFAGGLVVGHTLRFVLDPHAYAAADPWKFGYGGAVTLAGVLLASSAGCHRRPMVAPGVLIALGVINLKMGFRSLAGVCFLTAVLVFLVSRSSDVTGPGQQARQAVKVSTVSVLAGFAVVAGYGYMARHGVLGSHAQQKYERQQSSLGIVIGGRREIIAEALAIRDSPIVGHGSWAKDPKYGTAIQHQLFKAGFTTSEARLVSDRIPSHSYLFGAWVNAGILGAVFWLWASLLAAVALLRLHRLADGRVVLVAFLGFLFLWDVLFSPLGAEARLVGAFYLAVLLLARYDTRAPLRRTKETSTFPGECGGALLTSGGRGAGDRAAVRA